MSWTAPKVAKAIAEHLGPSYGSRGAACVALDLLRRQVEVRRRTVDIFDKEQRSWVEAPAAEIICEVTYPPASTAGGPYETLGVSFNLRTVGPVDDGVRAEETYPWPRTPPNDLTEPLWRDIATVADRALMAVPDPTALVRLLLTRGRTQTVDGLAIGQFQYDAYALRLVRALIVARMAQLADLEPEVLERVRQQSRTKGGAETLAEFAKEYEAAGIDRALMRI